MLWYLTLWFQCLIFNFPLPSCITHARIQSLSPPISFIIYKEIKKKSTEFVCLEGLGNNVIICALGCESSAEFNLVSVSTPQRCYCSLEDATKVCLTSPKPKPPSTRLDTSSYKGQSLNNICIVCCSHLIEKPNERLSNNRILHELKHEFCFLRVFG